MRATTMASQRPSFLKPSKRSFVLVIVLLVSLFLTIDAFQLHPFSSSTSTNVKSFLIQNHGIHEQHSSISRFSSNAALNEYSQRRSSLDSSAVSTFGNDDNDDDEKLPSTVLPILLSVLALILSEGIALSTLPLHMKSMGATPVQVGLSTSAFSVAQMVCCPLIVSLSSKRGRRATLKLCLGGAALSSIAIATSTTIPLLIFSRFLAGVFAAAIPVAQAGVTDLVPRHQATLALSRVSAASQTGLVIGPMASAVVQEILTRLGVPSQYLVRGVFGASAAFAMGVLAMSSGEGKETLDEVSNKQNNKGSVQKDSKDDAAKSKYSASAPTFALAQPLLRVIALAAGWALTLSVAIYSLFSSRFLGFGQSQLSASMSAGAATTILTQMFVVPRLVKSFGEHVACSLGLWALTMGLAGTALARIQPWHTLMYLLIRVGTGVTDTSTAGLVARFSKNREERAHNLGMIQSTRAGARIFTPVLSGSLFARSCHPSSFSIGPSGSLPYLVNAGLAIMLSPLPLLLKRIEKYKNKKGLEDDMYA